jgi:hypothetical protein
LVQAASCLKISDDGQSRPISSVCASLSPSVANVRDLGEQSLVTHLVQGADADDANAQSDTQQEPAQCGVHYVLHEQEQIR